jgi:hypothetical protein
VLTRPEDFDPDLNMLRRRYRDLADAPRVADGRGSRQREAVNELVRFNRSFRKKLEERQQLEADRAPAFQAVIRETDRLYQVWDAVRDARCEFYYVTVRRQALKKLKALLGDEAYAGAVLPPNVPTWRFNDLK